MKEKSTNLGYVQVTRNCNSNCIMCSNPKVDDTLSLDEIKTQIEKFLEKGANLIYFTGGEPTMSPHLKDAVAYCSSKGIECSIITNGINLSDRDYCQKLMDAGLKNVNFSLHSHEKEVNNRVTQKDNFSQIMSGLKNCYEIISPPRINFVISSISMKSLPKTVEFLGKNFPEISHFSINFIDFTAKARETPSTVPKFSDAELHIHRLFSAIAKLGKTFRAERIPLCYMMGFEQFSTETIRNVLEQSYQALYLNENPIGRKERIMKGKDNIDSRKKYKPVCSKCSLKNVCMGVCEHYIELHGFSDIYPVFGNHIENEIIKKVKKL